jgi:hypothetical protein
VGVLEVVCDEDLGGRGPQQLEPRRFGIVRDRDGRAQPEAIGSERDRAAVPA